MAATQTYDLIAIGAGPAGESATELASYFGLRCAVVERDRAGGTVTTTGGAPTKTLREAALFVSGFRDADVYGLRATVPAELAMEVVRTRTWAVCALLQDLTKKNILARGVDYIEGEARVEGDGAVTRFARGDSAGDTAREGRPDCDRIAPAAAAGQRVRIARSVRYGHDPVS